MQSWETFAWEPDADLNHARTITARLSVRHAIVNINISWTPIPFPFVFFTQPWL